MRRIALALACALFAAAPLAACHNQPTATAAKNLADGRAFLGHNKNADGVKTTQSGLQYKILHSGPETGGHPQMGDAVLVHYELSLPGQAAAPLQSTYEEGQPIRLEVGQVIPGWNEALQLMRPGDEWMLYLPTELAYGEHPEAHGAGDLPPNSALVFKVQLIDFISAH